MWLYMFKADYILCIDEADMVENMNKNRCRIGAKMGYETKLRKSECAGPTRLEKNIRKKDGNTQQKATERTWSF